jgi:hypothetical protein
MKRVRGVGTSNGEEIQRTKETDVMPAVLEQAAQLLGLPVQEMERQSVQAFFEKELRALRIEILAICQKYGTSSWEGLNELIIEDQIEEGKVLDDFQRVDHLTAKAKQIQAFLDRL